MMALALCSSPAMEVEGENTNRPNWLELPRDVTTNIIQKVGVVEILTSASQVCPLWRSICKDPFMWRAINMTILKIRRFLDYNLEKICRCAVERSCGHLEDISIDCFASDDLLKFIADCTNQLRRIRLAQCKDISAEALLYFFSKFPLLEELDISINNFREDSLQAIGRCCPHLKALKFNMLSEGKGGLFEESCDEEAFAIANTMPKLRYLHITRNYLSNDGLRAILDGCPLLEFLDLRGCYHIDLSGSLGKRCCEQIKDLRLPDDFEDGLFDDYPHLSSVYYTLIFEEWTLGSDCDDI